MAIWTRESSAMSTTNQYIKYRVKVTLNSQSVADNTSNVTVQVLVWRTNQGYTTYGSGTCYCKINGTTYTASITTSQKFTYNSDTVVFSKTINITHNSDGSKRLDIEARIDHDRFNSSPSWQSYNTNLNTIPRTSKVSLSTSSQNLGSSITIYTNRASSSFTHVITYKLGKASGTIGSNVGNSVTWTLPNSLANEITTSTSKSGTITCETYSGSTKIGTSSVTFTAIVPNNSTFNPSIGDMTHSEANSIVKNAIGSYVQKHSGLNIGFSGVSTKYGATIKSCKIEFDGKTYNSSSATTGVINGSGNLTIKGTITDSRGRTATKTVTINVLAYSPPKITTFTVFRCDSNGNKNPKGEYISVRRAGTGTSLNGKNQLTIVIKTKPRTSSTWTTKDITTTTSGSFDATKVFGGYDITTTYDVRVEVTDKLTKTPVALNMAVSTEQVAMSWGKTGIGVGKIWERGALDVGGDTYGERFAIQNSNGTYTIMKKDGDVAIGVSSPTVYDTTGAAIQIYHDGRIRNKASYLIDADGRIGQPMSSLSSGASASFTVPFGCVVLIWMNQGGAHSHRKGLWVVFASGNYPSDYSVVRKIAGDADITITTTLVSNGVRITVKNNDNPGSSNPWGYMMLAGY